MSKPSREAADAALADALAVVRSLRDANARDAARLAVLRQVENVYWGYQMTGDPLVLEAPAHARLLAKRWEDKEQHEEGEWWK